MSRWLLLFCVVAATGSASVAQEICYSQLTADFNTLANWNQQRDGSGSDCTGFADNSFVIQDGHTMSTTGDLTGLEAVTIETGGVVEKNHILANSHAVIEDDGRLVQAGAALGSFGSTSRTFAGESIIEYTTTTGFSPGIDYGHLIINGSGTFNPGGTSMSVRGDLTIALGTFRGTASGNPTHSIGGSIFIQDGLLELTSGSGSPVFEVTGDIIQTGGTVRAAASGATGRGTFRFVGDENSVLTLTNVSPTNADQFNLAIEKDSPAQSVQLGAAFNVGVGRTLTLGTGYIDATSHLFLLSHTADVVGGDENSYIQGEISQFISGETPTPTPFSLFYPFGADGVYRPFEFHATVSHTSTITFVAQMVNEAPPAGITIRPNEGLDSVSDTRYWGVNYAGGGTSDISNIAVTLHYGPDDDVTNPTRARVAMEDNNEWVNKGGTGTGTPSGQVSSTESIPEISVFPDYTLFAIGESDAALPVEIASFEAVQNGRSVMLRWETAAETNNQGFEVQMRRADGFGAIGFVEGAGTTSEPRSYSYEVRDLSVGTHEFRLKQLDLDGSTAFSPVVEIAVELAEAFALSGAYPNPFNPSTQFELAIAREQDVEISVHDVMGRRVGTLFSGTLPANESHTFTVSGSELASGVYLIRVAGADFAATRRVTLIK